MRPENPESTSASRTEEVMGHVKEYINTHVEILKLQAIDKVSGGIATVSLVAILVFLLSCVFILANIGLALWISKAVGDGFSGFFIVAGFYLLVSVLLFVCREALIKKTIAGSIIKAMWNDQSRFN